MPGDDPEEAGAAATLTQVNQTTAASEPFSAVASAQDATANVAAAAGADVFEHAAARARTSATTRAANGALGKSLSSGALASGFERADATVSTSGAWATPRRRRVQWSSHPVDASSRDEFFVFDTTHRTRLFDDIAFDREKEARSSSQLRERRREELAERHVRRTSRQQKQEAKEEESLKKAKQKMVEVSMSVNNLQATRSDVKAMRQFKSKFTEQLRDVAETACAELKGVVNREDVRLAYKDKAKALQARMLVRSPYDADAEHFSQVLSQALSTDVLNQAAVEADVPDRILKVDESGEALDLQVSVDAQHVNKPTAVDIETKKKLGKLYDHQGVHEYEPPWIRDEGEAWAADENVDPVQPAAGISSKNFGRMSQQRRKAQVMEPGNGGEEQEERRRVEDGFLFGRRFVRDAPHKQGEVDEVVFNHDLDGNRGKDREYDDFVKDERQASRFGASTKELERYHVHRDVEDKEWYHEIQRRRKDVGNPLKLTQVDQVMQNHEIAPDHGDFKTNKELYVNGLKEQGYVGMPCKSLERDELAVDDEMQRKRRVVGVENTAKNVFDDTQSWVGRSGAQLGGDTVRKQGAADWAGKRARTREDHDGQKVAGQPSSARQRKDFHGTRYFLDHTECSSTHSATDHREFDNGFPGVPHRHGTAEAAQRLAEHEERDGTPYAGMPSCAQRTQERDRHRYANNTNQPQVRRTPSLRSAAGASTPRGSGDRRGSEARSITPVQFARRVHPDLVHGFPTQALEDSRRQRRPAERTFGGCAAGADLHDDYAGLGTAEVRDQFFQPCKERHLGKRTFATAPNQHGAMFEGPRSHVPSAGTTSWQDSVRLQRERHLNTFCASEKGETGCRPVNSGLGRCRATSSRSAVDLLKEQKQATRPERAAAAELWGDSRAAWRTPRLDDSQVEECLLFRGQYKLHPRDGDRGPGWNRSTRVDGMQDRTDARSASPRFRSNQYDWVQPRTSAWRSTSAYDDVHWDSAGPASWNRPTVSASSSHRCWRELVRQNGDSRSARI